MPELPEVETVRTAIDEAARGDTIMKVGISGKKMRWPIPADIEKQIAGGKISALRRRGKYILVDIDTGKTGLVMLIHLGMSGSVRIYPHQEKAPAPEKHDHMVIDLNSGQRLILNDPRRFGGVDLMRRRRRGSTPCWHRWGLSRSATGSMERSCMRR